MAFYFSYSGHKCHRWLKIVNHLDKRDNSVMCTRKEIKSGLKLVLMEIDVETHTCKLILRKKPEHSDINLVTFFCKFLLNKGLFQTWAYFTLKLGWLKTSAGTNIGPQNNMFLSTPVYLSDYLIGSGALCMGLGFQQLQTLVCTSHYFRTLFTVNTFKVLKVSLNLESPSFNGETD